MYDARSPNVVEDLRFALDVLQASSHLGLDSEYTAKLRLVILQQIRRRESRVNDLPVEIPIPSEIEEVWA